MFYCGKINLRAEKLKVFSVNNQMLPLSLPSDMFTVSVCFLLYVQVHAREHVCVPMCASVCLSVCACMCMWFCTRRSLRSLNVYLCCYQGWYNSWSTMGNQLTVCCEAVDMLRTTFFGVFHTNALQWNLPYNRSNTLSHALSS